MNPDNDHKYLRIPKIAVLLVVILAVGLLGWQLGRSEDPPVNNQPDNAQTANPNADPNSNTNGTDVKSLVSYTLPDGWKETSCPAAIGSVYVVPNSAADPDCNANPASPVKISVDPANNKDCNQLQNVQNVSKHICVSEFINGKKSLKAETVYNEDSSYKKSMSVHAYYIDTGKAVIKLEYIHSPNDNEYQAGFEQLAKSVQIKG